MLRYHPDGFRIDRKAVMGRQSAGAGFIKGFVEHGGTDRLVALTDSEKHFEDFRGLANALDRTGRTVVRVRPRDRQTLRDVGTVFLPGPGLDREAWNRRFGSERDYSLCGVTHTIATSRVARALGQYLIAPTATVGRPGLHLESGTGRGRPHPGAATSTIWRAGGAAGSAARYACP